jgi:DNA-binding ferritin-like protein
MKLDRNINKDGRGKYALIQLRKVGPVPAKEVQDALQLLHEWNIIHWGNESPGDQFFVVKYKDQFAYGALRGYCDEIEEHCRQLMQSEETIKRGTKLLSGKKWTKSDNAAAKELHAQLKRWREYADEIRNECEAARNATKQLPA